MFAPRGSSSQGGALKRILVGLGLGTGVIVLAFVALVLFVASQYFTTPQGLYHSTWETTAQHIFDPKDLGDWSKWEHKYDAQIQTDDDAVKYANEMLGSLKDNFTYLLPAEAVKASKEREQGNFTGVGMVFEFKTDADGKPELDANGKPVPMTNADGNPIVSKVMPGGPAEKAGIKPGDALVSINGQNTAGKPLDEIVAQVRGQQGTTVKLGIGRDGKTQEVDVTRGSIAVPAVTTKMLPGNIGYLRLEDFSQLDAADEVAAGLDALKDARAIIFDLRSNPGGYVHNSVNISSMFMKNGTVVVMKSRIPGDPSNPHYQTITIKVDGDSLIQERTTTKSPNQVQRRVESRNYGYRLNDRPVVILVNGHSASASEMTTGAVRDNNAATVIGTRTFGKGIGQSPIPMPNGTELHVTSMRYYTPSGAWLGDGGNSVQNGIAPDIEVQPKKQRFEFGGKDDNQLESAVEILEKKLSGR